jgi:opacity protein-like surface antigen
MRFLLLIALAMAAVPTALAQPTSAYYGLAIGEFDYREDDGLGGALFAETVSSYRLMVGYQFTENLSFEGGWGKTDDVVANFDVDFGVPFGVVPVTLRYEFEILTVRFLGVLPFDNGITLVGGMGYADMEWDASVEFGTLGQDSSDLSEGDLTYFAGVQYDWERFALRLGYEKYDVSYDFGDIDETTLSFLYKL